MFLPIFGSQSAKLECSAKGLKKSRNLKSRIKSFLSDLTPVRRTLLFSVILFHAFLLCYLNLATAHNLSLSASLKPLLKFQAEESKAVASISSKTYGNLPNKGVPNVSSATQGSLTNKGVVNISPETHGSLANKGVPNMSSGNHSSLRKEDVSNISLTTDGSLSNKEVSNISLETHGSLGKKVVSNISSTRYDSLSNKGVVNISWGTHNSLAKEGVLNLSSTTSDSLPKERCDSGWIYVYNLPTMFNYDIMNNCTDIEPPLDKCEKNLNDGLGPVATEFAGMLPESILPAFYWTDMYWGEVIFHNRMLNHKCRTLEPESATAFYIPFYVGLRLRKYLFSPYIARDRDWHSEMLVKWLQQQKWWKRSNGSDDFIILARMIWDFQRQGNADADWGTKFLLMPAMRNVIPLSVERNTWENNLGIAVPYPSIFHPRSESDIIEWQKFVGSRRRTHLFTYVGGGRPRFKNDFRETLRHNCLNESTVCHHVDCALNKCLEEKTTVMAAYLDSDFCLQPRGDGLARQAIFDCLVAGSIPVYFWRRTVYTQYEFSIFPNEPESYSVFIHRNDVRNGTNIRRVLERYGREEVKRMRDKVIEYIPRFGYARPSRGLEKTKDAFDIAVDGVLTKYKDHMARGRLGNLNEI